MKSEIERSAANVSFVLAAEEMVIEQESKNYRCSTSRR